MARLLEAFRTVLWAASGSGGPLGSLFSLPTYAAAFWAGLAKFGGLLSLGGRSQDLADGHCDVLNGRHAVDRAK